MQLSAGFGPMKARFRILDSGLDHVALDNQKFWALRMTGCAVATVVVAVNISLPIGLLWWIASLISEGLIWFAARAYHKGTSSLTTRRGLAFAGAMSFPIIAPPLMILFWNLGSEAFHVIVVGCGVAALIGVQLFSARSLPVFISGSSIIGATLLALTTFFSRFRGVELASASSMCLVIVGFVITAGMVARKNAEALEAAKTEADAANVQAKAANLAKSAFVANMSHEIRTPLNGVLGMAQAMSNDDLSPLQRERLDVVQKSGEMLLAILNDVLDMSKIEAGKLELERVAFDLQDVAKGAHAAFTAIAQKKGLSFNLVVEPNAAGVYLGDPTRLRQIIYNLVSNALKFTDRGEVRVNLASAAVGIVLKVSDTGLGIPPNRRAQLFDKFEQADASTTRRFGGTGLGLSICRDLTHLMGGSIDVESVMGEGSVFTVALPLEKGAETTASSRQTPVCGSTGITLKDITSTQGDAPGSDNPLGSPLRILAAEDNQINQLVLKTLLHQIGIYPVLVDNGQAALDAWEAEDWDLILMDMQMPIMDGMIATQSIRDRETATGRRRTPIVALTANAMSHQITAYQSAGMDGFVSKPIDVAQLLDVIDAALNHDAYATGVEISSAA